MNPINRRGQKVVCVIAFEYEICGSTPEVSSLSLGEVYTVDDFLDLSHALVEARLWPGITLVEYPGLRIKLASTGVWEPMGWPLVAFRPVDERETDISDLVRLGTSVRQTEDA